MRYMPLKRVVSLALGALLCGGVVVMSLRIQNENERTLNAQAREQAQALVSYAARNMSRWLQEKNKNELALMADNLAKDPLITDVTLYDQRGVPIAQSGNALPLDALLPIGSDNATQPAQGKGRQPFVEEVKAGEDTLGYLRITFEEEQQLKPIRDRQRHQAEQVRLMLMVTLLAGFFISFGVRRHYVRVRKHKKLDKSVTPEEENSGMVTRRAPARRRKPRQGR